MTIMNQQMILNNWVEILTFLDLKSTELEMKSPNRA